LSMNNFEMEANSRPELLTDFKLSYGASLKIFAQIPEKFCPDMNARDIRDFIYMFFPFMFGIYPYTAVTEKQRTAMKEANIDYKYQTVYEITYTYLLKLLGDK
ncbi:MAG: TetR/AcrR family transcriptional regulator, partial [Ruminococcus sp.]|nr:TetR/AcrR family transcriptional regulator [Ruminococcus sp.]